MTNTAKIMCASELMLNALIERGIIFGFTDDVLDVMNAVTKYVQYLPRTQQDVQDFERYLFDGESDIDDDIC